MKTALTIAGSDCSGGAGIQADIKTMSAHGVYAMSVIVSVVAENTSRVIAVSDVPPEIIKAQIDAIFTDIPVDATKIGMLSTPECMRAVADKLAEYKPANVVIDPVMYAKNGSPLMAPNAVDEFKTTVLPYAYLITPNIPEAEAIAGIKINDTEDAKKAALIIHGMGAQNVLVKGGHAIGEPTDILYDGNDFTFYTGERIVTKNTHGTGCTLSSAIAANLALGFKLDEAIAMAKDYVTDAIRHALELGKGNGPTNHFYRLYKSAGKCE